MAIAIDRIVFFMIGKSDDFQFSVNSDDFQFSVRNIRPLLWPIDTVQTVVVIW
jgi:hypothetical protein